MGYRPVNIILFVFENQKDIGKNGPEIVARAFRATEQSSIQPMFSGLCVQDIFRDALLTQCFHDRAQRDTRHILLGHGRQSIDFSTVLGALFGNDVPETLKAQSGGEELRREIGTVLRERGVDWEDCWLEGMI